MTENLEIIGLVAACGITLGASFETGRDIYFWISNRFCKSDEDAPGGSDD